MAHFPSIDSPCPYADNLAAIMEGDFCRTCKRDVFDLTAMNDDERYSFLQSCAGEVCVKYTAPSRAKIAAAALAAAAMTIPMAAAAQDAGTTSVEEVLAEEYDVIIVGGIKDPKAKTQAEDKSDKTMAELPVEYEEDAPAAG